MENKTFLQEIINISNRNQRVIEICAEYLSNPSAIITKEIIDEIVNCSGVSEEEAFSFFLVNAYEEDEAIADLLYDQYFKYIVKKLDICEYTDNPYMKTIHIKESKNNNWSFGYQKYKPYEGFVYKDISFLSNHREIPNIGFFDKEYEYPTVFENGREWMAIKPSEIESMKEPIKKAKGKVVAFGMGLGYYAFMVSNKENVESVSIIEKDSNVINLFTKEILPQFPNRDKIRIIKSDAFEYAEKEMEKEKYDFAFVDLYHDVSDGTDIYIKIKKLERVSPKTEFSYWIEDSIVSSIRYKIIDSLGSGSKKGNAVYSKEQIGRILEKEYIKNLVKFI